MLETHDEGLETHARQSFLKNSASKFHDWIMITIPKYCRKTKGGFTGKVAQLWELNILQMTTT